MTSESAHLWCSSLKEEARRKTFEFFQRPFRSALLLPSDTCLDIIHGINSGHFDSETRFWLVERKLKVARLMVETLRTLTADLTSFVSVKNLERSRFTDIVHEVTDFVFLDTCGVLSMDMLAWQLDSFLSDASKRFAPRTAFAFNYYLPDRKGKYANVDIDGIGCPVIDFSDEIKGINAFGDWLTRCLHAYNIQSRMLPGRILNSGIYFYRSEEDGKSLMCSLMFDVEIDETIANERRRFAIEEMGIPAKRGRVYHPRIQGSAAGNILEMIDLALSLCEGPTKSLAKYRKEMKSRA